MPPLPCVRRDDRSREENYEEREALSSNPRSTALHHLFLEEECTQAYAGEVRPQSAARTRSRRACASKQGTVPNGGPKG